MKHSLAAIPNERTMIVSEVAIFADFTDGVVVRIVCGVNGGFEQWILFHPLFPLGHRNPD